ncbi:MAG: chitobiase/beta-hexosaminidase C-terminal domain-containing protein [Terracidiphilus sp.]|jgi:hypothetical protein
MTSTPPPVFTQIPVVISSRIFSRPRKRTQMDALWAVFCCCLLLPFAPPAHPQGADDWAWMSGSSSPGAYEGQPGISGTLGTFAAGNAPASRWGASSWTNSSGNLWLFGGYGIDANGLESGLNDLWEFNPSTNEWAWVGGSIGSGAASGLPGVYGTLGTFAAGNIPGTRYGAASWTDHSGNLWLFGGSGYDGVGGAGWLNDLWEFNPSTKEWAWISGSDTASPAGVYGTLGTAAVGNVPGGRDGASSWIDKSGNLWLFGGMGYGSAAGTLGWLNDLWEFNPSTKEWTWVSGSGALICQPNGADCIQPGVYGTLGVAAAGNVPGSREWSASWMDTSGNLWLFAGGLNLPGSNDLWRFNPSSKEWAWMGGSSATDQSGVYGTLGTPAALNIPGSRIQASNWTDSGGNFWLCGGEGYSSTGNFGLLGDLWKFTPSTNEWTWIGGSNASNPAAEYGILGTPAVGSIPGAREGAANWLDTSGNLWLFGGNNSPNDLWKYQLSTTSLPAAATPTFSVASGTYAAVQTLKISDKTARATIYYSTNATSETPVWTSYSGAITVSATETISAVAMASGHSTSAAATASYTINLPAAATPTFSLASGTYTTTQTVTISDATAGATIYYTTNGAVPTTSSTIYTGPIAISSSETIAAIAVAPGYSTSAVASATYTLEAIETFLSLASSSNPSNVGQYVTFYATVTAPAVVLAPPGSVQFSVGGVAMGSPVPLNGTIASYTTAALFAGSNSITATYIPASGSGYTGSTSTLVQSVAGDCSGITATTLTSSQNPSTLGQSITLSATVAATAIPACVIGTPGTGAATYAPSGIYGTVQFTVNGVAVGSPITISSGSVNVFTGVAATYTTSVLAAGTDTIGAVFIEENGYFESSTATVLSQVVNSSGFILAPALTALSIPQGAIAADNIAVTDVGGFTGSVTLGVSGLPNGLTAVFSTNPAANASTITFTVGSAVATGTYTITITGTSGTVTGSTTIVFTVTTTTPSFPVSALPASLAVTYGGSGTSMISVTGVTAGEFPAGVSFQATNLPSGVTASFGPTSTTETSVLTLSVGSTAAIGTYAVTVSAIGNISSTLEVLLGSTTIELAVTGTPPSTCTIDYVIQPQNIGQFGVTITIDNTGTNALAGWTLAWTFANGQTISTLWNGVETQSGANVTVTNESYNGSIPAGTSYTGVGFNGTWNGATNAVPTAISLNGMACVVN